MINFMAKIKCSNCGFTISCEIKPREKYIKCPLCKKVMPVNAVTKTIQTFSEDLIRAKRPKTHFVIIMILTYIFSLGVVLAFSNVVMEYRPQPDLRRTNLRQDIMIIISIINSFFILDWPFKQADKLHDEERKSRIREGRRTSFIYYFTYMCIFIILWYIGIGKYVLLDLNISYDGTRVDYLIEGSYRFYTILYNSAVLCCYIPYLIYFGFNLNFEYSDTERYFGIFTIINAIVVAVCYMNILDSRSYYYYYKLYF